METSLAKDIERGLSEKRARLDEWCATCEREAMMIRMGQADETKLQDHMQVIDASLQKLGQGVLGECEVCHGTVDSELLRMDYTACVCLDHYSEDERRQLETELELSQVIQRAMLPQKTPAIAGLDISAFSRPAQIIGGDYFDFLQFKDGSHGFVVADVSGHGVSAAMLMTSLQTAFRTLVPETDSPVAVLERINRLYIHNINFTTFVTVFFSRFDPAARTLTYANAGHNHALLHRGPGQEAWLGPTGPAIGLTEGFNIAPGEARLEAGSTLVLYTDGVTEAGDSRGELFGRERLAQVIRRDGDRPAAALIRLILEALNDFTGGNPLEDDITLMICKAA
jgi:sigma-B regulation protein RsbU (phosphoserine phosphatase)